MQLTVGEPRIFGGFSGLQVFSVSAARPQSHLPQLSSPLGCVSWERITWMMLYNFLFTSSMTYNQYPAMLKAVELGL